WVPYLMLGCERGERGCMEEFCEGDERAHEPWLINCQHDQRGVVCPLVAAVGAGRIQQPGLKGRCGESDVIAKQCEQLIFTELHSGVVTGFRNAVCEQHQAVAAAEFKFLLMVIGVRSSSKDGVFCIEPLDAAISMSKHWPVVSGVSEAYAALLGIQDAIEEGDELAWNTIGRNGLVNAMTERSGIVQLRRQHAHRCLQVRHEKRRSHALAHYVGNAQGKRTLVDANDVVVIAAYAARSLRGGGYRHSCRRAGVARHEPTLDLRGVLLFLFVAEPLLPEHAGTLNLLTKHAQQLRVVPGLLHKVAGAAMHGLDRQLNRAPRSHHDYGQCAVNGQSLRHQLQAFTAGRGVTAVVQVEQSGVKVTVAECLQRIFRALYKLGFVAIALEQQMQRHDNVRLVFSYQNARPLRDAVKFKRRNGHNRIFSLAKHTFW